jgi:hypothetical protein
MKATQLQNKTEEALTVLAELEDGYRQSNGRNSDMLANWVGSMVKGLEDSQPWIEAQERIETEQ